MFIQKISKYWNKYTFKITKIYCNIKNHRKIDLTKKLRPIVIRYYNFKFLWVLKQSHGSQNLTLPTHRQFEN